MNKAHQTFFTPWLYMFTSTVVAAMEECPPPSRMPETVENSITRPLLQNEAAMLLLAERYLKGYCLPKDTERGRNLYEHLAVQGSAEAHFRLGLLYLNGYGVEQNFILAEEMFRRAIAHGHPKAKSFLEFLNKDGFDDC